MMSRKRKELPEKIPKKMGLSAGDIRKKGKRYGSKERRAYDILI